MTGLEKILYKIEDESKITCSDIIAKANAEAQEIISNAEAQAKKQEVEIVSKATEEAERKIAVARSSAETISRTKFLEVRNAIVNDIISAAYEEIVNLDEKAYFDLLYKLCLENVETGECVMYLSKKDTARVPKDFEDKINSEVYQKGAVQVSKQSRDIENGFILDYGDFEINCTLRAVFDEKMDELRDLLCRHLFSK